MFIPPPSASEGLSGRGRAMAESNVILRVADTDAMAHTSNATRGKALRSFGPLDLGASPSSTPRALRIRLTPDSSLVPTPRAMRKPAPAPTPGQPAPPDEVIVWDGRIARIRRPFVPSQQGAAVPDFDLGHDRARRTASRNGWHADPAEAFALQASPRPSAINQRAADHARSRTPRRSSPRERGPSTLDATWLAPEQRDLLAIMDERRREAQHRVEASAQRSGRVVAGATQIRPWHDSGRCLQMALPKLRAMSADVTIDDVVVGQIARLRALGS